MTSDVLKALKRSEPIIILASLSLAIAAFTFQKREVVLIQAIYNFSVISGFMFIFSFVCSIIDYLLKTTSRLQDVRNSFFGQIPILATYFFLAVGIIFLIAIAYQFGQEQPQIFAITKTFLFSIFSVLFLYAIILIVKRPRHNNVQWLKENAVEILPLLVVGQLFFIMSIDSILESIYGQSNIDVISIGFVLIYISPIVGISFLILLSITINSTRKQIKLSKPTDRTRLIISNILLISFIAITVVLALVIFLNYSKSFGMIDKDTSFTDLFEQVKGWLFRIKI